MHLKGTVGYWDFDPAYVDWVLKKYPDQEVNVLIDSLGGKTNSALSIYAAFKNHGQVNVHFVGMNASAATIASLGAKHISIDSAAMYLVHKCSIEFFEWSQMNSDDLKKLIEAIEKDKENLDKIDSNVAEMYAKKCKKPTADLLDLMKKGGWLTAKEALEWGFVDEITDLEEDEKPVIDRHTLEVMANAGIPLPKNIKQSAWVKFINALKQIVSFEEEEEIKQNLNENKFSGINMKKEFKTIQSILKCESLESNEGKVTLTEEQLTSIEDAVSKAQNQVTDLSAKMTKLQADFDKMKAETQTLKEKPAEESKQVVSETGSKEAPSAVEDFINARQEASDLYHMFD